ncbi:MAG: hypothetical protein OXJ64_01140, partial [Boseongicola sp.]|nr:hypothetical protein [Boseongicola sp.]
AMSRAVTSKSLPFLAGVALPHRRKTAPRAARASESRAAMTTNWMAFLGFVVRSSLSLTLSG